MGTRIDLQAMDDNEQRHKHRGLDRHPDDVQLENTDWENDVVVAPPSPEVDWTQAAPQTRPRRRVWPFALATLGVGGLVAGVIVFTGGDSPRAPAPPVAVAPDAQDGVESLAANAQPSSNETSRSPDSSGASTATSQQGASTNATTQPTDTPKPPTKPGWVAAVERMNPWVTIEPARGKVVLGVPASRLTTAKARASYTGFFPNKDVTAPTVRFAIQQHEVTWAEVERFVDETRAGFDFTMPSWVPRTREARARLPATGVPWELANAYCQAIGGNLPSEAEWEWAARGKALSSFPWGDDLPFATRVQIRRGQPIPLAEVNTRDQDKTPAGVVDMLGNAQEWTRDRFTPQRLGGVDNPPGDQLHRAVRGWTLAAPGGSIPTEGVTMRHSVCAAGDCPANANEFVGFRCVK